MINTTENWKWNDCWLVSVNPLLSPPVQYKITSPHWLIYITASASVTCISQKWLSRLNISEVAQPSADWWIGKKVCKWVRPGTVSHTVTHMAGNIRELQQHDVFCLERNSKLRRWLQAQWFWSHKKIFENHMINRFLGIIFNGNKGRKVSSNVLLGESTLVPLLYSWTFKSSQWNQSQTLL